MTRRAADGGNDVGIGVLDAARLGGLASLGLSRRSSTDNPLAKPGSLAKGHDQAADAPAAALGAAQRRGERRAGAEEAQVRRMSESERGCGKSRVC